MKIIAIIPARYDSTRFPGKPLALIAGRPMIQHVCERSAQAGVVQRVVVATDDHRVAQAVNAFGGEVIMTREDHPSGTDRIAEAARILQLERGDMVINVQGDEPMVSKDMIEVLVESLKNANGPEMATLAFPTESLQGYEDPHVVKVVVDMHGRALYFSRSPLPFLRDGGSAPLSYLRHLGFYAYRNSFLQTFTQLPEGKLEAREKLEQLRALEHGHSIQVAISPRETHGVDTPEDLATIERQWGKPQAD